MSVTKFVNLGSFLRVKVWIHQFPSGACQVSMNCITQDCGRKCGISFKTPPADWNVTHEHHAEKFYMLCAKLEKLAEEIVEQNGQISLI